jgi:L-2-hydroxyglutarate oxidase
MEALARRAIQNDIAFQHVDQQALRKVEPAVAGLGALLVPATGYCRLRESIAGDGGGNR